jgi:biotin carboxyl carrier protein
MQYAVEVNGRVRHVAVRRQAGQLVVDLDGQSWTVDAVPVAGHGLSLLVSRFGRTFSHDVTLAGDAVSGQTIVHVGPFIVPVVLNGRRRSGRKEEGEHSGSGPQRLLAPMPGKVVRVLVNKGDPVRARQPMVVIEAMKMENELRAGRDGVITELPVSSGQSVEAGTLIAVVSTSGSAAPQSD